MKRPRQTSRGASHTTRGREPLSIEANVREHLPIPAEYEIAGTYFPPMLLCVLAAICLMMVTVSLLNRYRLSRYFLFPNLMMLSITIIYTAILGTWVFPT